MSEHDYPKLKRTEAIARAYNKHGFASEITECGNQILFEVEQDLHAMKWAISYLSEYIEYREKTKTTPHTFGDNSANQALEVLIKRVAEYSCPNNLKAGNNCPLKDKCTFPECRK